MPLAAAGIHEPFSMNATRRFWYAWSIRWLMKSCMGGKKPPL